MIIFLPLILVVYLLMIAIDVLMFFAIIRLLHCKWATPCLSAFNATGTPVVDWFTNHTERVLHRLSNKTFSQRTQLSIGIAAMVLARALLTAVFCN
jgi:hypothetical protein